MERAPGFCPTASSHGDATGTIGRGASGAPKGHPGCWRPRGQWDTGCHGAARETRAPSGLVGVRLHRLPVPGMRRGTQKFLPPLPRSRDGSTGKERSRVPGGGQDGTAAPGAAAAPGAPCGGEPEGVRSRGVSRGSGTGGKSRAPEGGPGYREGKRGEKEGPGYRSGSPGYNDGRAGPMHRRELQGRGVPVTERGVGERRKLPVTEGSCTAGEVLVTGMGRVSRVPEGSTRRESPGYRGGKGGGTL